MNCPICGGIVIPQGGCYACIECGWGACDSDFCKITVDDDADCIIISGRTHIPRKKKKPVTIENGSIIMFYFNNVN